ncbi:MAG: enoyl-CoA hydratase/isomerase family protein [Halobacteriales archaeon]|nr:enoyl-CoA hydratase/isomerase family protein [Halobacteriales archaeon]
MNDLVPFERSGSVGRVTFRRPEARNQVDVATMRALIDALSEADAADIDVLVLRGEGGTFSIGRDQDEDPQNLTKRENLSLILDANDLWTGFEGVTVAAVTGEALGFGCAMAVQADVTLAADDARLGFTEIDHGFAPSIVISYIETYVSRKQALDLVMTGRVVPAETAREMGLVTRVLPAEGFDGAVDSFVETLTALDADALLTCKTFMREIGSVPVGERADYALDSLTG